MTARHRYRPRPRDDAARHDRLLPWIATERTIRAIVLLAIGIVLVTHPNTNWGRDVSHVARALGFDPSRNGVERIIAKLHAISPHKYVIFGIVAIAYGILEAAEAYGLWLRRRWGEVLTVIATSLLFIPEIWEIAKSPTALKFGALALNVAVVVYLVVRLRRRGG
jgi:uncharacterized membrane protein (DUF2068 family)